MGRAGARVRGTLHHCPLSTPSLSLLHHHHIVGPEHLTPLCPDGLCQQQDRHWVSVPGSQAKAALSNGVPREKSAHNLGRAWLLATAIVHLCEMLLQRGNVCVCESFLLTHETAELK